MSMDVIRRLQAIEAILDRLIRGNRPPRYGCAVYKSSNTSIATGSATVLTFDTVLYDDASMWSGANPARITVPAAGRYMIGVNLSMDASATGDRQVYIEKNGTTVIMAKLDRAPGTFGWQATPSKVVQLAATDYIRAVVTQTSGGALNVNADGGDGYQQSLWVERVSD